MLNGFIGSLMSLLTEMISDGGADVTIIAFMFLI
jgi:hypothetical protein